MDCLVYKLTSNTLAIITDEKFDSVIAAQCREKEGCQIGYLSDGKIYVNHSTIVRMTNIVSQ